MLAFISLASDETRIKPPQVKQTTGEPTSGSPCVTTVDLFAQYKQFCGSISILLTAPLCSCLNNFIMPRAAQDDWLKIKLDYVQGTDTLEVVAERHGKKFGTVRWHAHRERWQQERQTYQVKLTQSLNTLAANKSAADMLRELDIKQLKRNEEMRFIIDSRLKERDASGKVVPRKDLAMIEVTRAVTALGELYHLDKEALGVKNDALPAERRDRFSEMSESELYAELERVRKEPLIQ